MFEVRFDHIPGHDPQGTYWQGYEWSSWYAFSDLVAARVWKQVVSANDLATFLETAGLYRLRIRRSKGRLLYIGQTGRGVHSRLRGHMSAVKRVTGALPKSRRGNRPFARRLAAALEGGTSVQASWTPLAGLTKPDRLGVEAELIAAYRATVGENPTLQFLTAGDDDDDAF